MPTITFFSSSTSSDTTHCDLFVCSRMRKSDSREGHSCEQES
jgi:hypothetical protein